LTTGLDTDIERSRADPLRLLLDLDSTFQTLIPGDQFHGFMPLVGENDPDARFFAFLSRVRHRDIDRRLSSEQSSRVYYVFFFCQPHGSREHGRVTLPDF
jgi:hypothetical protein